MNTYWLNQWHQLNHIAIELKHDEKNHTFHYQSIGRATIYGRYFPATNKKRDITVCLFHGLGAHTHTSGYEEIARMWQSEGFNVIGFDVRNQGGKTVYSYDEKTSAYGLYVSGILSSNYYYMDVYLDAIRLVDVAKIIFPNDQHIISTGGSQGGALAIFVGMIRSDVTMILADMPSNIDIKKLMHTQSGHRAFLSFLKDHPHKENHVLNILKKVDLMYDVKYVDKPILLSSGDLDQVCPLSHTLMFYESIQSVKDIKVYEGFGHGGYDDIHFPHKLSFIKMHLK